MAGALLGEDQAGRLFFSGVGGGENLQSAARVLDRVRLLGAELALSVLQTHTQRITAGVAQINQVGAAIAVEVDDFQAVAVFISQRQAHRGGQFSRLGLVKNCQFLQPQHDQIGAAVGVEIGQTQATHRQTWRGSLGQAGLGPGAVGLLVLHGERLRIARVNQVGAAVAIEVAGGQIVHRHPGGDAFAAEAGVLDHGLPAVGASGFAACACGWDGDCGWSRSRR